MGLGQRQEDVGPFLRRGLPSGHVEPVRDQGVLQLVQGRAEALDVAGEVGAPDRLGGDEVEARALRLDQLGEVAALGQGLRLQGPPALDRGLEVDEPAIEPGAGEARGEVAHQRRGGAALGEQPLGRVVGGVKVDVGQRADQALGPAGARQAGLLAGHELQGAVSAEMQHRVGAEILAQVAVEGREGVRRGEAALEEQPHRVAFVAEARLHADEDVPELGAEHEDLRAVAVLAAGGRAPLRLDLGEVPLAADVLVGRDAVVDVGGGPEPGGVAAEHRLAQRLDARWNLERVALGLQRGERVVERLVDRQEGGRADAAGVRGEAEQHHGDPALGPRLAAQGDEALDPGSEGVGALRIHDHVAGAVAGRAAGAAAEHRRRGGAVEFGDRHHHGGLHRREAAVGGLPLLQRLELQSVSGEVGHVEGGEQRLRPGGVVVGGAADEGETGERDQRIDGRAAVALEEGVDRRAVVEPAGEGRHHREPARLQGGDDPVVMGRVPGEHIGAHDEEADAPLHRAGGHRHPRGVLADPSGHAWVIEAGLGIAERRGRGGDPAPGFPRARRVAPDEEAHEVGDVLVRPREPVLQGEKVGPHVLRRARDEAQDLGQLADHRHLAGAVALGAGLPPQALQEIEGAAPRAVHVEAVEAGRLHDLARREAADHGVAMRAPGEQGGEDRPYVLVHEQHGREHDVAPRDVGLAGLQGGRIGVPGRGGVEIEDEAGQVAGEALAGALQGAREMVVHRHEHDPERRALSVRNALSHRTASRG